MTLPARPHVPVLLYHSIRPDGATVADPWAVRESDFRRDVDAVLATGRPSMTATHYARWLTEDDDETPAPVLITFDDGFADFADFALPVLAEHGLASTVFVTTGWVDRPGMLSRDAIRQLPSSIVEVGAHTVMHPHLDTLGDDVARRELMTSRESLEEWTGDWVTSVAYPHGSHSRGTRALVRDCGYVTAHAVKNVVSHQSDDILAVGRYTVRRSTSRAEVVAVLDGRGAPRARRHQRVRTRAYRHVRRVRASLTCPPAILSTTPDPSTSKPSAGT